VLNPGTRLDTYEITAHIGEGSADGSRFLFSDKASAVRETVSRFDLVLNWTATLPH